MKSMLYMMFSYFAVGYTLFLVAPVSLMLSRVNEEAGKRAVEIMEWPVLKVSEWFEE